MTELDRDDAGIASHEEGGVPSVGTHRPVNGTPATMVGTHSTAERVTALFEEGDQLACLHPMYMAPITTRYFIVPMNDEDSWIETTSQYFNHLRLPKKDAKAFLERWLAKILQARSVGGVNGMNWQNDLSRREEELAHELHFKNFYTNCGMEMYLRMVLNAFID